MGARGLNLAPLGHGLDSSARHRTKTSAEDLDTCAVANLACLQPPSWPGETPSASPAVSCA